MNTSARRLDAEDESPDSHNAKRRLGIGFAVLTALLWGFLAIAMKIATEVVPVVTIVWFRFTFAFLALSFLIGRRAPRRLSILWRPPALALVAALGLTLNYLGYIGGLNKTSPSNAQIIIQIAPLLFAGVGVVLFRERLSRVQVIGVVVAIAGFTCFHIDQRDAAVVSEENLALGNMLLIGGAIAWVVYAALQKLLAGRGHAPQDLNLILYALPAVTLWVATDFGALLELAPAMWGLMIFMGANTLVAYGALGEALKRLPAYQVSVIITCNPLITLAAMAVLGSLELSWAPVDRVGVLGYVAAVMVVAGVIQVLVMSKPRRARASTHRADS